MENGVENMVRCQKEGCNGILKPIGRAKAECSKCGTIHRELTSGNWMPEEGAERGKLI